MIKKIRGIYAILFTIIITRFFSETMWQNTVEYLKLCSIGDITCANNIIWFFFKVLLFIIIIIEITNIFISKSIEKKRIMFKKYKHDTMIASIRVFNNQKERINNCVARVTKVNVIGKNKICRRIIEENVPDTRIYWNEDEIKIDLDYKNRGVLDIVWATENRLDLLFWNHHLSLPLYPDKRNGEKASKAKYQIEINVRGIIDKNGKNTSVSATSYWEIYYRYKEEEKFPVLDIQKIKSLNNINNVNGDLGGFGNHSFTLKIKK